MTAIKSDFWVFAFGGKGDAAWGLETSVDAETCHRIKCHPGPIDVPPLVAEAERPDGIEDVPYVYSSFLVVSDRVRRIIEEAGPTDCQFLPIDIRHKGRSLELTYWAMHVLRTIDCADHAKSSYVLRGDGTIPLYCRVTIIPERVPPEVSTFHILHSTAATIIRDSLRKALRRAKVTGALYYRP